MLIILKLKIKKRRKHCDSKTKEYSKINKKTMSLKNTAYKNLWNIAKEVMIENGIALNAYMKRGRHSNNNLSSPSRNLEKEEQNKPKANKRKEIIKVRSEIN